MRFRKNLFLYFIALNVTYGGTVSDLIDYQLYKDFAMNKGKFKVGATNVVVERKDGSFKVINLPIPDFSTTDSSAVGTLIDPNYVAGVKHNRGYTTVKYGYNTGHTYKLIDRNEKSNRDYHTPRLNKVVTDVAPTKYKQDDTLVQDWKNKYSLFARVGSGIQYIQSENGDKKYEAWAYEYLTGGIITSDMLYKGIWVDDRGENMNNYLDKSPLPIYIEQGDSGSPLWGFNNETQEWELVAFGMAISSTVSIYIPVDKAFMEQVMGEDYLPEVNDIKADGEIVWGAVNTEEGSNTGTGTITQGDKTWTYNGLKSDIDLSKATNDELNFTKHLTFSGEGGTIKLEDSINMGAGKLTFKNDYVVKGETGRETWVGAGIEIAKDKEVLWQVNGVKGDALHKIGEGTLHVNAIGKNEGALNVGDGIVILDQQADENGNKQAFDYIDIVSGRATVVLKDSEQIDTSKINFGFRGGRLDVDGNKITFGDINAVDFGAMIVNHNNEKKAVIEIDTDKFKKDTSIYHGHFGENDKDKVNGEMDVNISGSGVKTFAVTGGSTLNGNFNLNGKGTTLILSGERDLHAGEDIKKTTINGDYYSSQFDFKNVNMSEGTEFQGGVYSIINGNINTNKDNKVVLGYVDGESELVYDSTQETKTQTATKVTLNDENTNGKFKKITTFYKGDLNIENNSDLKVGYARVEGNTTLKNSKASFTNSLMIGNITQDKSDSTINEVTLIGNLDLYNGSNSAVSDSVVEGNIKLGNSHLVLKDSQINGKISATEGKLNLYSTVWTITEDSQVDTLLIGGDSQIKFNTRFVARSARAFSTLEADNFSGSTSVTFNANSSTGESDKLIINNLTDGNSELKVDLKDNAEIPNYGSKFKIMEIKAAEDKSINIVTGDGKDNKIDIGSVKVGIKVTKNEQGDLILDSSLGTTPDSKPDGDIVVDVEIPEINSSNQKVVSGSTTNTMAAEYAARGEVLRSQKRVIKDSMRNMDKDKFEGGAYYVGNYSESKYESDKFRKFDQKIINHGFAYEKDIVLSSNLDNYAGVAFIYGKSNIEYGEGYSGNIESFSGHVYSKLVKDNELYLKGDLGLTHLKEEINERKFETNIFSLGTGVGIKKEILGAKLITGVDMNLYYLPGVDYTLDFKNEKLQRASVEKELVVEIVPEIRLEKQFHYGDLKLIPYGALSYEFNDYLFNKAPELKTAGTKIGTALIERGGSITIGGGTEYKNLGLDLEVKYLIGEYGAEKLTGTLKLKYRF